MPAAPQEFIVLRGLSPEEVAASAPPASSEVIAELRDLLGYTKPVVPGRKAAS